MSLFKQPRLNSTLRIDKKTKPSIIPKGRSSHNDNLDRAFARMRSNDVVPTLMNMEQARLENEEMIRILKLREAGANNAQPDRLHPELPDIETVHVEDPTANLDIEKHILDFAQHREETQDELVELLVKEMATLSAISTAAESVGRISSNAIRTGDIDVAAMRDITSELFALSFMRLLGARAGVDWRTMRVALNARAGAAFTPASKGNLGGRGGKALVRELIEAVGATGATTRADPDPAKPRRDPSGHLGVLGRVSQRLGGGSGGEGPFGMIG